MIALSFITGIFFWTFMEYILHRFLGHVHKGKNFFKTEHVLHHSTSNYFAPKYKKAIAASIFTPSLALVLGLIFSFEFSIAFSIGFILMYMLYEVTHFRFHAYKPLPFFLPFRKHHFYHHYHDPSKNHGVTTRFWDRVFGTFVATEERVCIPRRMSPKWMLDETENTLQVVYESHFKLVGKK